ncbi:hypothetical protein DFR50_13247 [Roseiarcus fermentans]|uniref:Uncharacterized protein n=1 Tax=Roseiarcus fermentans TaxID=1473586 RepID=A0A366EXP3_9HYPH|nr:hypothetical protein DFR50_13247 [Roseiarcus fermentans]
MFGEGLGVPSRFEERRIPRQKGAVPRQFRMSLDTKTALRGRYRHSTSSAPPIAGRLFLVQRLTV